MPDNPTDRPGNAPAIDLTITVEGECRLTLEQDGNGVTVPLTAHEMLAFLQAATVNVFAYLDYHMSQRATAGNAKRVSAPPKTGIILH